MIGKKPPKGSHTPMVVKGEEMMQGTREPGRAAPGSRSYRTARDATSVNPGHREPIDPRMPNMPPA